MKGYHKAYAQLLGATHGLGVKQRVYTMNVYYVGLHVAGLRVEGFAVVGHLYVGTLS